MFFDIFVTANEDAVFTFDCAILCIIKDHSAILWADLK